MEGQFYVGHTGWNGVYDVRREIEGSWVVNKPDPGERLVVFSDNPRIIGPLCIGKVVSVRTRDDKCDSFFVRTTAMNTDDEILVRLANGLSEEGCDQVPFEEKPLPTATSYTHGEGNGD